MDKQTTGRFEGVIMKQFYQEAGTETDPYAACVVIDEATGETIVGATSEVAESDFEIVNVQLTATGLTNTYELIGVYVKKDGDDEYLATSLTATGTGSAPLKMVMYKGYAYLEFAEAYDTIDVAVTGDIEYDGMLIITGEGTITLTEK